MNFKIPIEVSARHCHLAKEELEKLFGEGYELKKMKQLSMPSDFAAEETVTIRLGDKKIENVRIVGPLREQTQVEISKTDAVFLGVNPPVRLSGDLSDSLPVTLTGPEGSVDLGKGLIIALHHLHCTSSEAEKLGIKNMDAVAIKIDSSPITNFESERSEGKIILEVNSKLVMGKRPVIFGNVAVRVRDDYKLCLHLDTDEGNAAGINKIGEGEIL